MKFIGRFLGVFGLLLTVVAVMTGLCYLVLLVYHYLGDASRLVFFGLVFLIALALGITAFLYGDDEV